VVEKYEFNTNLPSPNEKMTKGRFGYAETLSLRSMGLATPNLQPFGLQV
jgi:hypothetical protein